ncbi:SIR2-domain-containing protein [Trametes versicolor FP-101664 SS1]|uniref:SIR2-domain-containing protein n=1 Tax=Trametes versicolor (strain FP-101664) TaxID=717944 RepID=UPI00046248F2|nr:SIR2-domain-containing protein [Trametes versicolor FP-101664 SS1]EIW59796.1 SIR2-domain-containing protein [Trametes versicolor FP-101664 SS1]
MKSSPLTPPTPSSRGNSPAGDPPPPPPRSAASKSRMNTLYAAQLRAFLEAAEVVDVDPDVIEDLLNDFPEDSPAGGEDGDVDVEDEAEDAQQPAQGQERVAVGAQGSSARGEEDSDEDEDEDLGEEWTAYLQEAETAWTKQEVKDMMVMLKEQGMAAFLAEYVVRRAIPIPKLLYAFNVCLCPELRAKQPRMLMYLLRVALSRELGSRERLLTYNTIDDVVRLIHASRRILILTGAGISVSCGIPDFRSRNGLYASLQENGEYDLDDPQQMFDIQYFRENPAVFYSFASKIYPSNFIPSPCHRFIKLIEDKGKLLRNYTQNIDTLETLAGVQRVVQCHGSFATASCIHCRARVPGSAIADDIMSQRVPLCTLCNAANAPAAVPVKAGKKKGKKKKEGWDSDASDEPEPPAYPPGIMKASWPPDITFFGEKLDDVFERSLMEDRQEVDLLIIIGTSLKVSPVSETISHLPHSVPQILINKTPIKHINPDVVLLGNADDIVLHLCGKLGWDLPEAPVPTRNLDAPKPNLKKRLSAEFEREPRRVGNSHVWLFEGAEGGRWVEEVERRSLPHHPESGASSASTSAAPTPFDDRQAKKHKTE